jgi:hypothetical protein
VITLSGVNNVKISGFTIKDSYSSGVKSLNSSLTIAENQFIDNETAIYLAGSEGTIEKNVFDHNIGGNLGSISIRSSQASVSGNTFIGGEAVTTDFEAGYGNITTATILQNTFTGVSPAIDNNADRSGCSIRIIANVIKGGAGIDKGISNDGPAVISENTIEKFALYAILNNSDQAVIASNLLRENGGPDGAAIVTFGTSTITGNTILNNSGHGVKINNGVATINGNTFKDNSGYGVSSVASAIIMGNTFDNNSLGCIDYGSDTVVSANLCNDTLSVNGTITSPETLTIQAGQDMNITTGRDMNIATGRDMNMHTDSDISITADGNISTNASETSITSSSDTNINSIEDTTITTDDTTTITSGGPVNIIGSTVPWTP